MEANAPPPGPPGKRPASGRGTGLAVTLVVLLVGGAMFTIGVFVGRQTMPIHFDIDQLNRHLVVFREGVRKENEEAQVYRQKIEDARTLDFPEALKTKGDMPMDDKGFAAPAASPAPPPNAGDNAPPPDQSRPKALPQAPPPVPASGGRIVIQVASLQDVNAAGQMVARLQAIGQQAYWVPGEVAGKGTWYRVRVGSFATKTEAIDVLNRLAQNNITGIILETRPAGQ